MATSARLAIEIENRPRRSTSPAVSALVIGGFGLVLLLISGGGMWINHLYQSEGIQVIAKVTNSSRMYSSRSSYNVVYYRFTLSDGRTFTGNQSGYSGTPGSSILIDYLPSSPSTNRVDGSNTHDQKRLPLIMVAGAFFVFIGWQAYIVQRRKLADR
ncbi:MAG TPA: DUF3592 domain-containing protein [Terriglobales bacterium]